MKAVLITSGGMDSTVLAYFYKRQGFDLHLVGFDYGQRHVKELGMMLETAKRLDAKATIVPMSFMANLLHGSSLTSPDVEVPDGHYAEESMRITVVPNRNMVMLSIAGGIAVADNANLVATGVHAGDHYIYPDCRPEFISATNAALILGNEGHSHSDFRLEAPFVDMTKAEIAALGNSLEVNWLETWSCYKGGEIHCGTCGTCYERQEAFHDAEVNDPTVYLNPMYEVKQ